MGTEWGVALRRAVFWLGICAGWRGQSWQGAEHVADGRCALQPRPRHRPPQDCPGLLVLECLVRSRVSVLILNLVPAPYNTYACNICVWSLYVPVYK